MLYDPLKIGTEETSTRLVLPPMASHTSQQGEVNGKTVAHYLKFAANPALGMLFTEHSYITPGGKAHPSQLSFASDEMVPAQQRLTEAIHKAHPGLLVFAQLSHAGAHTRESVTGEPLVSASAVTLMEEQARELTVPEIHQLVESFARAAVRVKKAGYDGVEIHAAHGYLLNQFLSPLTNHRTDGYGPQLITNRTRFLREVIQAVRNAVGEAFPIAVRLGGCDYLPGGSTVEDGAAAAALVEEAGADLVDVSGGMCIFTRPGHTEPGWFSDLSQAVEKAVSVPVILTGGIQTPDQAEALLKAGKADLIGVGRAMLRNPRWGQEEA